MIEEFRRSSQNTHTAQSTEYTEGSAQGTQSTEQHKGLRTQSKTHIVQITQRTQSIEQHKALSTQCKTHIAQRTQSIEHISAHRAQRTEYRAYNAQSTQPWEYSTEQIYILSALYRHRAGGPNFFDAWKSLTTGRRGGGGLNNFNV